MELTKISDSLPADLTVNNTDRSHITSLNEGLFTHELKVQDSPPRSHQTQVGRSNTLQTIDGNILTDTHSSLLDEVRLLTEQ